MLIPILTKHIWFQALLFDILYTDTQKRYLHRQEVWTLNKGKETNVREERVSMNIALSPEDRKFLKVYAAERETTVAALIAEYVAKLRKEAGK